MQINRADFAEECVRRAVFFGVNPHYMIAVASMRSLFNDDAVGGLVGPFRLTQAEWDSNRSGNFFELELQPTDITFWDMQCAVFALMTYQTQNKHVAQLSRFPSAVELYHEQWPDDTTKLPDALQSALNATSSLIGPAADKVVGDPTAPSPIIADPVKPLPHPPPVSAKSGQTLFQIKAPGVMNKLIDDFQLSDIQAAGVLGNIGHECNGFRDFQERNPIAGRGGFGWAQWTGSRRNSFETFCKDNDVSTTSDEGNYGFLKFELTKTAERAVLAPLRATASLKDAVSIFVQKYERAGVTALASRLRFAKVALDAFKQSKANI